WHQHQPYYPNDLTGENEFPWVRLHGTKDYWGMARHIQEVPEFRCTINLVPSLLVQLLKYTDGGGSDRHLDVSRMPADGLSQADAMYLVDHFFMANGDSMIRPSPRYHELFLKRKVGTDSAEAALSRFSPRDLRDLQVWSNLAWMHPILFEVDSDLRAFRLKGQSYSEADKAWLLDKQAEVLQQIIPMHRELAKGGQVELTTTPFYHPILPLLWDKRLARQAMPDCELPKHLDSYREDAVEHLRRAVEFHEQLFGERPRGMWPSEGSVAQEIIGAIADVGIEWIATDEEILVASTGGRVSRDSHGHQRHPELLYRPWLAADGDKQLQMVFRDKGLSDLIGFQYQRADDVLAAMDLLGRIEAIGQATESANGGRPTLVPIILDGENCWEYYRDGGVTFLRTLYHEAARRSSIQPVRIGDHLREHPATDRIDRLFAGSWISHNFAIWIGHHEDRTAWDLLHDARERLKLATASSPLAPSGRGAGGEGRSDKLAQAWQELFIAEGSDWFWWYGPEFGSAQDKLFDRMFRTHLQNIYSLLGEPAPANLNEPIKRNGHRRMHTLPSGFLPVKVDGRATFFEWISAGIYEAGSERGTMAQATEGLIRRIHFGFDKSRLLLRVDTASRAREDFQRAEIDELRIRFVEPEGLELTVGGLSDKSLTVTLNADSLAGGEAALGPIFELGVTLTALGAEPGSVLKFFVEVFSHGQSTDRAPRETTLELTVPPPDFEQIMWQV
ncbi:MAG: alpha-amylase/alpha-mannosidase, partial [Planctomycetaceae bacterium]|nr:alpha-amylase/alpha-mannosidase [Planctomycetaceae bacterium]